MKTGIKQIIKMAAQNVYLPAVYCIWRRQRVEEDLVLLADAHHDSRPENMQLLYEELKRRGMRVEEQYLDYQHTGYGKVLRSMTGFMKQYARAGTVVICDNFLPAASCRKKKETQLVQLWHACGALKRFGYDTTDDIPAGYKGNVFRGIDLVTVSAPVCRAPFASAMQLPEAKVQAMGVSRTDRYFDPAFADDCRRKFGKMHPEAAGKKVVLWAPTFRGNPGRPESIDLDLDRLQESLGDAYLVLASLHPHMRKTGAGQAERHVCRLSTEEMFPVTDVLIADYSSLVFEYCLTGKGLVLYTPDFAEYTKKRGFYMPYEDIPGKQVWQEDALPQAVRSAAGTGMDEKRRREFINTYMCACDGQATGRIADWITHKA